MPAPYVAWSMAFVNPSTTVPWRTDSLAVTPSIVAHRGACAHRPEHTMAAYRLAIAMGADDLEIDVVSSADGVLVARHENEISATTDVATRPEFAARHAVREVDGVHREGWFTEDFTLAELKTLTARERLPASRPASAAYDGMHAIPTLNEILAMVQAESTRHKRMVGLLVELKHATYFAGRGLPLGQPLTADLRRHEVDHARSRVSVMSFETTILRQLNQVLRVPLIQLLDRAERRPADLRAIGDPRTYADLVTPEGLAHIDGYADGIGAHSSLVLPREADGSLGKPTALVRDAHRLWLDVLVWTLRAENRFLPTDHRRGAEPDAHGDLLGFARRCLDAGVDGLITDYPGIAAALRQRAVRGEVMIGA